GGGRALRNGLVEREQVKSVAVRSVAGDRSGARVSAMAQICPGETHSGSTWLQRTGVDLRDVRLDDRDGVQYRPWQRDIDVVDDEHQLPGSRWQAGPAQLRWGVVADAFSAACLRQRLAVAENAAGDRDCVW